MAAVVRVLWGADVPNTRWTKVWKVDVPRRLRREDPSRYHVYVYGESNRRELKRLGVKHVHLVDKNPYPRFRDMFRKRGKKSPALCHPWIHKHELVRAAVRDHGEVIYCDWDVGLHVEPSAAFDHLHGLLDGRKFLLSLFCYRRPRGLWHPVEQRPGEVCKHPKHLCVTGNWMYCDGPSWPLEVLPGFGEGGDTAVPAWHDEFVMTKLINERHGGWPGEEVWLRTYESPVMVQRRGRVPWVRKRFSTDVVECKTCIPFRWRRMFA